MKMKTKKQYFVKSLFSGWCEVNEEKYYSFIENIRLHASGLASQKKEEYIKKATRIVTLDLYIKNTAIIIS